MCTTAEGKAILLDKPDGYSWKEWHQKLHISTTEKKHTVEEIQNKRHVRPSCTSLPFFLILRSRPRTAAALCWVACGVALRCCRGADVSIIWSLHFGLIRAARTAAAVTAAVLGPAWAGTAGPRLHEDDRAVVLWAEVRTVWRAVLDTSSGKLDLNRDEQIQISGVEEEEWVASHCDVKWAGREASSNCTQNGLKGPFCEIMRLRK